MSTSWREPAASSRMEWVKCKFCPKKFFKADAVGRIEIVCSRCKVLQTQEIKRR